VAVLLVTPTAAAYLLAFRLSAMMLISAVMGGFSSLDGLYLSDYLNVASGAAVVVMATRILMIVFFFNPRWELAWRKPASPAIAYPRPALFPMHDQGVQRISPWDGHHEQGLLNFHIGLCQWMRCPSEQWPEEQAFRQGRETEDDCQ
jgi:hypothetical protein